MTARPDAPELSAAEQRFLDRPDAPESLRERVAVAIHAARYIQYVSPAGDVSFTEADSRILADAALAVVRGETS